MARKREIVGDIDALKARVFQERVDAERRKMSGTWGTATIGKPVHRSTKGEGDAIALSSGE